MEFTTKQVEAWFEAARQLDNPDARRTYLASVCGECPEAHAQVLELLERHERADAFFDAASQAFDPAALGVQPPEQIGGRIGRYRLVERVGEGGCGVVYAAEQEEPVRRRVALKIIKLGMDTVSVLARFDAERQVLATMDHPNIARLFDGGTSNAGRPYFVMEFVHGAKITDFCRQNGLSLGQRLDLFTKVCQAIHHAHQKGIIHRDLKPSNVLVALEEGQAVPKVIDFGIAKATHTDPANQTHFTVLEQLLGTPAYMSPEQAAMKSLDVDTRSDIYSLGVLLYELLTGKTPFETADIMTRGLDDVRRDILDREPVRPSIRLKSIAEDRPNQASNGYAEALPAQISPDLDWIVLKCLEKDRTRRYASANEIAQEIQRHLNDEPILARPPSHAYRFQKFAKRNKFLFGSGALTVLALALGTTVAVWQAAQATRAMKVALRAQANEASLRRKAQAQAYTSDMSTAYQLWREGNLKRARELLRLQIPEPGQPDLRGFEWRFLDHLFRDESSSLESGGRIEKVRAILVASNYSYAVVCGDKAIGLVDPTTKRVVGAWAYPHPAPEMGATIPCLASGSSKLLALNHTEREVGFYDLQSQSLLTGFSPLSGSIGAMSFSPDGRRLAAAAAHPETGGSLLLYKITTSHEDVPRLCWSNHCDVSPTVLRFSPDGRFLVGNARTFLDGSILAWDANTGLEQPPFPPRSVGYINDLAFSPDGKWLATGGVDSSINIWDFAQRTVVMQLVGHRGSVNSLAYSMDGHVLVSAGDDGTIRLWNLTSGECLGLLRDPLNRNVQCVALAPDGKTILSSCGGELRFWKAEITPIAETIQTGQEFVLPVISPNSEWLVTQAATVWTKTFSETNAVKVWELATRQLKFNLVVENHQPMAGVFSPDGRYFVLGGEASNRIIAVWETAKWDSCHTPAQPDFRITNSFEAGSIAFSPNGKFLAAAGFCMNPEAPTGATNRLSLWEVSTWRKANLLAQAGLGASERSAAGTVAFSRDSRWLAVGSRDGWLRLWDLHSEKLLKASRVFNRFSFGMGLSFSDDGRWLAVFEIGNTAVRLFDLKDLEHPKILEKAEASGLFSGLFSPDSRSFVTAGNDGFIKFWKLETMEIALALEHSHGPHVRLAFSEDGDLLVSTDSHGTMRLWPASERDAGR